MVNVVRFPARPNASNVVEQARAFASRVESGELQGVSHAVLVFATDEGMRFASWGEATPAYAVIGMMETGKLLAFAASVEND